MSFNIIFCFLLLAFNCKARVEEDCNKSLSILLENIIENESNKIIVTDFFVLDDKSYIRIYPVPIYISNKLKAYDIIKDAYILYYGYNDSLANNFLCLKEDFHNISLEPDNNSDFDINSSEIKYYQILNNSVFDDFEPDKIFLNSFNNLLMDQKEILLPPPPPIEKKGIYPFQVMWNLDNIPYFQEGEKSLYNYIINEIDKYIEIDNETITFKLKISEEGDVEEVYAIYFSPEYHEELISLPFSQFIPAKINNTPVPSYAFFSLKL